MPSSPPEHDQREQAQTPDARDNDNHRWRVVVAPHDRGERVLAGRGEERESAHGDESRPNAGEDGDAGPAPRLSRVAPLALEQHVCDDAEGEPTMPEHVQPGRALGPGAKQTGRRE